MTYIYNANMKKQKHNSTVYTVELEQKNMRRKLSWAIDFGLSFSDGGTFETMRKLERVSILRPD